MKGFVLWGYRSLLFLLKEKPSSWFVLGSSVVLLVYSIRDHRDWRLTTYHRPLRAVLVREVPPSRAHHPCRHALIIAALIGTAATWTLVLVWLVATYIVPRYIRIAPRHWFFDDRLIEALPWASAGAWNLWYAWYIHWRTIHRHSRLSGDRSGIIESGDFWKRRGSNNNIIILSHCEIKTPAWERQNQGGNHIRWLYPGITALYYKYNYWLWVNSSEIEIPKQVVLSPTRSVTSYVQYLPRLSY